MLHMPSWWVTSDLVLKQTALLYVVTGSRDFVHAVVG